MLAISEKSNFGGLAGSDELHGFASRPHDRFAVSDCQMDMEATAPS